MQEEKEFYTAPSCRILGVDAEERFLQSGGSIDPGTDDPWEDDY